MSRSHYCATVLVVADQEVATMLNLVLQADGHACAAVHEGRACLELCDTIRFDCLLLAAQLGRIAGVAVAERLAGRPSRPAHIVLMSARPRGEYADYLRSGIVDDYLCEPADPFELAEHVRASLRPRASRSQ